ncbi:ATP-dependent nuclease [Vibrio hibernica]|uniref:AAA family ATPase n=1 Tax=Vibrio hibernica TaxID=2587465 RepID=UPI0039B018F2
MFLQSFRVRNFRSINDSGLITTEHLTSILGRNESGKSNLLLALQNLNPANGIDDIEPIKNFPRDRRLDEASDNTNFLETYWILSDDEKLHLSEIFPRAVGVEQIKITRNYSKERCFTLIDLSSHVLDHDSVRKKIKKAITLIELSLSNSDVDNSELSKLIKERLSSISPQSSEPAGNWCKEVIAVIGDIRKSMLAKQIDTSSVDDFFDEMEELAISFDDKESMQLAINWLDSLIPLFVYVDDYPNLSGHHNLNDFNSRKSRNSLNNEDEGFEKLCKVAGIDVERLISSSSDSETRNQLVNRSGAIVTKEIRRLWKDRELKIRFNVDSHYFDTYISDPNSTYDVEVNLDERSRGFKWFFSFYITFFADTANGDAENAIILLDEPGLYLHAKSQSDLLKHLTEDFTNQIIFTTHSPFMVPTKELSCVKTVSIDQENGTTVTNDPSGDSTTLFPLQAALGYDIAQSLFIGSNNLVVEGVTDYWYLSSISDYLKSIGRVGLNSNIVITPAGGAQKVSYMVSLLSSQNLNVVVLLDEERDSKVTKNELVSGRLIHKNNVLFVSDCLQNEVSEADIEDLLDREKFQNLIRACYGEELQFNEKIPRVAKQVEFALKSKKLSFVKSKPAREFMKLLGADPEKVMSEKSIDNFEALFSMINRKIKNASKSSI